MSHVKVCMRIKPNETDTPSDFIVTIVDPPTLIIKRSKGDKAGDANGGLYQFNYTSVLENCTNQQVYDDAARGVVDSVIEGYNGTVMAYGQTGSGKTYTMLGPEETKLDDPVNQGVIPRALGQLFSDARRRTDVVSCKLSMSYVELYCEEYYDLLKSSYDPSKVAAPGPKGAKDTHTVVQDPATKSMSLTNITPVEVASLAAALKLVESAQKRRAVASHLLNERSSRSHTILSIIVETLTADGAKRKGKLNLVDLAGSENVKATKAVGKTAKEGKDINKSLLQLRMVVTALAGKLSHIPYRNSPLTWFLSDSLGGNCKTSMIACIWGDESKAQDSVNTCKFAQDMMKVEENAKKNEDFVSGPGNLVHLSPAVQKIMNAMIEVRLAQAAKMNRNGGGCMSDEDRAEIARNEATIKALHEEVKREEARARALEEQAEKMKREIDAERAQLEQQKRELEADKLKNLAIATEKDEDERKENERLRQLLEQQQLLLKQKEEELQRQAELNRQDVIPAEAMDNQVLMKRMKEFSNVQKELRAKREMGTITPEEEEEELFLRDDLNAMRMQLGISLSPSDNGLASPFADVPLHSDSESEYASDIPSPSQFGPPSPEPYSRSRSSVYPRKSSASGMISHRSGSVDGGAWGGLDEDDNPDFAPSGLKKQSLMRRMFSGGRKSKNEVSALTASNLNALQAAKKKAPDSIVIVARMDHEQLMDELSRDSPNYGNEVLDLDAMSKWVGKVNKPK